MSYKNRVTSKINFVRLFAAVLFFSLISSSITFAKSSTPPKSVFEYLYNKNQVGKNYVQYAKKINKKAVDKGITVTLNEVVYDGNLLNIAFIIQSKEMFTKASVISGATLTINKKDFTNTFGGGGAELLDDHTCIEYKSFLLGRETLPQHLKLEYEIKNIGEIEGTWDFKFNISGRDTMKKSKTFSLDTNKSIEEVQYKFKKAVLTPTSTCLQILINFPASNPDNIRERLLKDFLIFDDKGRQLTPLAGTGRGENNSFSQELYFDSVKEASSYLTVLPIDFMEMEGKPERIIKEFNGNLPLEISQGSIGSLSLEKVDFLPEKTVVHYTVKGKAPLIQAFSIFFVNEAGEEVWSRDKLFPKNIDENQSRFTVDLPPLQNDGKLKVGTINYDNWIKFKDDLKFNIPLKN